MARHHVLLSELALCARDPRPLVVDQCDPKADCDLDCKGPRREEDARAEPAASVGDPVDLTTRFLGLSPTDLDLSKKTLTTIWKAFERRPLR